MRNQNKNQQIILKCIKEAEGAAKESTFNLAIHFKAALLCIFVLQRKKARALKSNSGFKRQPLLRQCLHIISGSLLSDSCPSYSPSLMYSSSSRLVADNSPGSTVWPRRTLWLSSMLKETLLPRLPEVEALLRPYPFTAEFIRSERTAASNDSIWSSRCPGFTSLSYIGLLNIFEALSEPNGLCPKSIHSELSDDSSSLNTGLLITSPTDTLSVSSNIVLVPSLSELLSCSISVSNTSLTWADVKAPEKAGN
nr:hypothetical protein Iba_chr02bCG2350 [Ipomoea batatas]